MRARHTGEGVARRKAHQERQRDEREQREEADRAAGTALPPEEGGVELVSADEAQSSTVLLRVGWGAQSCRLLYFGALLLEG